MPERCDFVLLLARLKPSIHLRLCPSRQERRQVMRHLLGKKILTNRPH